MAVGPAIDEATYRDVLDAPEHLVAELIGSSPSRRTNSSSARSGRLSPTPTELDSRLAAGRAMLQSPMRLSLIILVGLSLSACDPEPSDEDGGSTIPHDAGMVVIRDSGPMPVIDAGAPCGTTFAGEPDTVALVGEMEGDVFVPFDDDHQAYFEWGFQGGTMILPRVGVPRSVAGDTDRCFQVMLRHLPDPAAPELFGVLADLPVIEIRLSGQDEGDMVLTEAIFDQIAYDEPTGARFLLEATVRGATFAATHTVAVEVVSRVPPICQALATRNVIEFGGCDYRLIPGSAVVSSIEASGGTSSTCPDPQRVMTLFEPDDPTTSICFAPGDPIETSVLIGPTFLEPPASCLTDVTVGSRIPATYLVIVGGRCVPSFTEFDLPACEAACPPP